MATKKKATRKVAPRKPTPAEISDAIDATLADVLGPSKAIEAAAAFQHLLRVTGLQVCETKLLAINGVPHAAFLIGPRHGEV